MVYGLYNDPEHCIEDALRGHVTCNDSLRLIDDHIVVRYKFDHNKVSLVTGGGSGHEPSHAGIPSDIINIIIILLLLN